jgi:phage terminase large subunit GpA-like protein
MNMNNNEAPERAEVGEETLALFRRVFEKIAPPPDMTLSQWADTYRFLSQESSSAPGRWKTDIAPYQREPMNAITDTHLKKVVLMWAAQMGKTDCAILNLIGYYMHYDPCPIMILQPTVAMAETVSKNRLSPMLRDTPVLAEITQDKSRNGNNTIQEKQFPGGYVVLQGANSPAALASRPIRILAADEIDRYPPSAGKEGDPLALAEKRTTAFWNAKEVVTSTPTIKGQSRIETEYEHSTQEVWNVPCPCCGKLQPLTWEKIKFDEEGFRNETNMEVFHECEFCGVVSTEQEWRNCFKDGKYIATYPRRKTRGFYVNALAATFGDGWKKIVSDFLIAVDESKAGNVELLITWTNTVMAQTWDDQGEKLEDEDLLERLEEYDAEVPEGVIALTAGVDTQDDRFEYEIVGWGIGAESWGIYKGEIYGNMKEPEVWQKLDEILGKTFEKADGTMLKIAAACIDSGGHYTNEVYRFTKAREQRNIHAIKGKGGADVPYIQNPTRTNRVKALLYTLGVDTGKCFVYDRLKVAEPGRGFCHFPAGDRGYDENYFKGLTAEKRIVTYKKGRATTAWVLKNKSFRRNEPLDMRNYAQAAMEIAGLHLNGPEETKTKTAHRGRRQRGKGLEE